MRLPTTTLLVLALSLTACDRAAPPLAASPSSPLATAATVTTPAATTQARMTVDGKPWQADREYFTAFHPPGLNKAVLMAASRGPKDKHEQVFNLNLAGVGGPGTYTAKGDTMSVQGTLGSAFQLANLSDSRYLIGGPLGFEIQVELLQAGAGVVEARFHGSATASDGSTVKIEDGYFLARE